MGGTEVRLFCIPHKNIYWTKIQLKDTKSLSFYIYIFFNNKKKKPLSLSFVFQMNTSTFKSQIKTSTLINKRGSNHLKSLLIRQQQNTFGYIELYVLLQCIHCDNLYCAIRSVSSDANLQLCPQTVRLSAGRGLRSSSPTTHFGFCTFSFIV